MGKTYRPEWTPKGAGEEYASRVMPGQDEKSAPQTRPGAGKSRRAFSAEEYIRGVLAGDRPMLARAITIIESNSEAHFELGQEIVRGILPHTGASVRVGITGAPGAGKSTFIEALGNRLCDGGHRVAVLAVDPSSTISKGSIMGDKTRMEQLSRRTAAFIRPSPSGGTLGGVTRKSRETLLLCEAAGFDTIIVETVGVGQSETAVRQMTDFFMVLVITGAGDELQGIKKGVIETADVIAVNKADGDNRASVLRTRAEYEQVLHYLRPATKGWTPRALACSALTGEGVMELWGVVEQYIARMKETGQFTSRRQEQAWSWVIQMTDEHFRNKLYSGAGVREQLELTRRQVLDGRVSAARAAQELIAALEKGLKN